MREKKLKIIVKVVIIFLLIYIHIVSGKDVFLGRTLEQLEETLGVLKDWGFIYVFLSLYSDYIRDEKKRLVFKVRLKFLFVLLLCINNLKFIKVAETLPQDNFQKEAFKFLYLEEHLGLLMSMILYKSYLFLPVNLNIGLMGVLIFISIFILGGKIIGTTFRGIKKFLSKEAREARRKNRQLIREKRLLDKQIKEKEKREAKEREARLKLEEERKRLREEKVKKLKKYLEELEKGDTSKLKQLSFKEIKVTQVTIENPVEKEEKREVIPKEQLKLSF